MKSAEFRSECGRAKRFFSLSSMPNELIFNTMFYHSVCLQGPHEEVIRVLVSECDDFEDCNITSRPCDVIKSRYVIDDVTNRDFPIDSPLDTNP